MEDGEQMKQKVISENIKLFDNLAKVYDAEHGYMRGNYLDKIADKDIDFILSLVGGGGGIKNILDVGGGTGFLSVKLLKKGCEVDVIDISAPMLDALKEKTDSLRKESRNRINFFCGNAEGELRKLVSGKKYDVVACSAFLHHIFNFEEILDLMSSLVKKGGIIFIFNEPLKGLTPTDYLDTFFNKLMHNKRDLIPAAIRGIFGKEIFWDYDTRLADYHITHGKEKRLRPAEISKFLEKRDFKIICCEEYTASNYKIFHIINKYIFHSFNDYFKIIAQKL